MIKFKALALLNPTCDKPGEELMEVRPYSEENKKELHDAADFYSHTELPGEIFEVRQAIITTVNQKEDNGMSESIIVLGAGEKPILGAVNCDIRPLPGIAKVFNLDEPRWPFADSSADRIIAEHVLEHMHEPIQFLQECHRILRPGGRLILEVPNWKHELAHFEIEHRKTFGRATFDGDYAIGHLFRKVKVDYRLTIGLNGYQHWWIRNEFVGRQIDKVTGLISGFRFELERLASGGPT